MNLLILGKGKTGSLVAEVAGERGHKVSALDSKDNADSHGLTGESLSGVDAVIDFTNPEAVLQRVALKGATWPSPPTSATSSASSWSVTSARGI